MRIRSAVGSKVAPLDATQIDCQWGVGAEIALEAESAFAVPLGTPCCAHEFPVTPMRVCFVQPNESAPSETFIAAQAERLPWPTTVLFGRRPFRSPHRPTDRARYLSVRATRLLTGQSRQWEFTQHSLTLLSEIAPDVVVAQFGPTGVRIMDACRQLDLPLIVNFRGADASDRRLVAEFLPRYQALFEHAAAIVAVSHSIESTLLGWGAPRDKLFWNPSGADCERFVGSLPASAPPDFLSTGRFVDKKAPQLTILAFAEAHRRRHQARLRMIGDGPLLGFCRELVSQLQIENAVTFLGIQPHERVEAEMRRSRGFIQHSVVAPSGDSEGTPVAVMEAAASGLPVVATRHAGIPDVVLEDQTGYLVDEGDVFAMASCLERLIDEPDLAATFGQAGRRRVVELFSQQRSLERITAIIENCYHSHAGQSIQRPLRAA